MIAEQQVKTVKDQGTRLVHASALYQGNAGCRPDTVLIGKPELVPGSRYVLVNQERPFFNWEHRRDRAANWSFQKNPGTCSTHTSTDMMSSIGRKLDFGEWRASQGFRLCRLRISEETATAGRGFRGVVARWCQLRTYKTANRPTWTQSWQHIHRPSFKGFSGSDNVDVVYGLMIASRRSSNPDEAKTVDLQISFATLTGRKSNASPLKISL